MEDYRRYIAIVLSAVALMVLILGITYFTERKKRVNPESATLQLQQTLSSDDEPPIASPSQNDTINQPDKASEQNPPKQTESAPDASYSHIRQCADKEGYYWQQTLQKHRFRESAESSLIKLTQHAQLLRDSLETEYAENEHKDSVLTWYDRQLEQWQTRLTEQVSLLPTALEALQAEQITEREYKRIIKESAR